MLFSKFSTIIYLSSQESGELFRRGGKLCVSNAGLGLPEAQFMCARVCVFAPKWDGSWRFFHQFIHGPRTKDKEFP